MLLATLKQHLKDELNKVDQLIKSHLCSEIKLIEQIGHHIVHSGGKRLRPMLVIICARACGYSGDAHTTMAAAIEFIHTATLLHDDVVDDAQLRRGRGTANSRWGNEVAVLVGDFLYSRAFQLMVGVGNQQIMQVMANATNKIAEGEVLQLLHQRDIATTEADYLQIIRNKTARLFEAAAEVGGILAGCNHNICNGLAQYGLHLGTAYQLLDDVLDYTGNDEKFGKQLGNDLQQGKATMPLIYLLSHGTQEQRELIIAGLADASPDILQTLQTVIIKSGALEYTREFAKREAVLAKQALFELPSSSYNELAIDLAEFAVIRTH